MTRLGKRVALLEEGASESAKQVVLVFAKTDEMPEDCIRRAGHDPDDPRKHFIVLQWLRPSDLRGTLAGHSGAKDGDKPD